MFLKILRELRHTLALRLTIWYAGIFAFSSCLAFMLVFVSVVSVVQERTDEDLEDDITEFADFLRLSGLDGVKREIALESQGEEAAQNFFRIWTLDGHQIMATDLSSWSGLGEPHGILQALDDDADPIFETLWLPQREHAVRSIYGTIGPGIVLQIGESLEEDDELIEAILGGFLVALAAVILLGGPTGWFMARRALRGVEEISRTATEIAGGALDRRVPVRSRNHELDKLAQTFNTMLDRIQALITGMREMTDNLAHDLRSPIARIRASAEMAFSGDDTQAGWETLAANTTEECDRLLQMINTTLDIAEAESGAAKLEIAVIDLTRLVLDACELFQTVAEDRHIHITTNLPERCLIEGDRQRLQRVLANLLDNALKFTSAGGKIKISANEEEKQLRFTVQDTGIGIDDEDLPHIFERFYRGKSVTIEGSGLGLAMVKSIVNAHGGEITVDRLQKTH